MAVIARHELLPTAPVGSPEPLGIACLRRRSSLADCVDADDIDTRGYRNGRLQRAPLPTVRAIKAGKDIALANKETLVVAGDLINSLLAESSSKIYPVDSEHSAIAQCLLGEDTAKVRRLLITASGDSFRTRSAAEMENATAADALQAPQLANGRQNHGRLRHYDEQGL